CLGAEDFLIKPITPTILMAKQTVILDLYRKHRALHLPTQLPRARQPREHERQLRAEPATWAAARLRRDGELPRNMDEEKERSAVMLQCIREAVVAVDEDRRVTLLNHAAEDLIGLSNDQARGTPIDDVLRLVDPETRALVAPEEV